MKPSIIAAVVITAIAGYGALQVPQISNYVDQFTPRRALACDLNSSTSYSSSSTPQLSNIGVIIKFKGNKWAIVSSGWDKEKWTPLRVTPDFLVLSEEGTVETSDKTSKFLSSGAKINRNTGAFSHVEDWYGPANASSRMEVTGRCQIASQQF
jgi:hypothetical protein